MNARIHRSLTALLSGLAALSALLAATDPASLALDATTWAWLTVALAVANIAVTAARQVFEAP